MPTFDISVVIYLIVFLATIVAVNTVLLVVAGSMQSRRQVNRRLQMSAGGIARDEILLTLRRERKRGFLTELLTKLAPLARLEQLLVESGSTIPLQRFVLLMIVLTAIGTVIGSVIAPWLGPFAVLVGAVVGIVIPIFFLKQKKSRRVKKFAEQLPDGIDMMVRALRAGHPVLSALQLVSNEMKDPIGSEFGLVCDEIVYGLDLPDAMEHMRERVNLADLHYMVVAINIQMNTGGNLADVLSKLSDLIRDRFALFRKAAALSAEGRLAATIIGALPVVVFFLMTLIKTDYYLEAAKEPGFTTVMAVAGGLYLGAMFIIYKIVQIEV
jgi:tight adherence protein B